MRLAIIYTILALIYTLTIVTAAVFLLCQKILTKRTSKIFKMKTTILTLAVCILAVFTGELHAKTNSKMKTIVLVHGAWLDASSWDKVIPALKAAGHEVINVNLPGHGKDNTPIGAIDLQSYVDAVKKAIGNRRNVILIGHSMGGIVISEVAEQMPSQIKKLVYVAAFLPGNGESLLQLATKPENKESLLTVYLRPDKEKGTGSLAKEGIRESFVADAPEAIAEKVIAEHKPDPLAPFATPANLTDANFGQINKTYVYTLNDKAVTYPLQESMTQSANVSRTYALPSSHTPFYSMPQILSAIFVKESE